MPCPCCQRSPTYFDEPFGDSSALATFRIAQVAGAGMRVVLTGDGGDEAFAGYPRYRSLLALDRFSRVPRPVRDGLLHLRDLARRLAGRRIDVSGAEALREILGASIDDQYIWLVSMTSPAVRARLLRGDPLADQSGYLRDALGTGPSTHLERAARADILTYLPEDLMVKMDRATMASSLEARAPFLDHELVEFTARIPADRKLRGRQTKPLLREIAEAVASAAAAVATKVRLLRSARGVVPHGSGGHLSRDGAQPRGSHSGPPGSGRGSRAARASISITRRTRRARCGCCCTFELWARRWLQAPPTSPG